MCVALDPQTGAATVVGAGHPPLLVARHEGKIESIASASPPLGLIARSSFSETPMQFGSGDLFLLYTDGLYGSSNGEHRHRLEPAILAKRLRSAPPDAESLLQHLLRDAVPANADFAPADDIAALAVRRQNEKN